MERRLFERYDGTQVTDPMLQEAAQLFSEHYGVWSEHAAQEIGKFAKAERLRAEYLPDGTTCSYAKVTVDGRLAGNAFACRWVYEGQNVCWVTQLVVHKDYRERGPATGLLSQLRQDDDAYGVMSSHPAACLAAAKAFSRSITAVRLDFIKEHAEGIMKASPIRYVREAKVRGRLFDIEDGDGLVSSVDTGFWVDHAEPLEALARARDAGDWPLGELHEGHEFLLVVETRRCIRSTTSGAGTSS